MRSQEGLGKACGEIERKQRQYVKSHHMEDIVGILLHNTFIKLPGSNQKILEKKDSFDSPGHAKHGKKTCYILRSQQGLEKVLGKIKSKQRPV